MFAQLGSVVFEVVGALTEFGARREYSYAEHARIEGKPTLQFTGEGLESADLGFALDDWLCEPADALRELQAMAAVHQAVALLWGDGRLEGDGQRRYVIRGIDHTVALAAGDGRPTRITGRITLAEWTEPPRATEKRNTGQAPAVGTDPKVSARAAKAGKSTPGTDFRSVPPSTITRSGP